MLAEHSHSPLLFILLDKVSQILYIGQKAHFPDHFRRPSLYLLQSKSTSSGCGSTSTEHSNKDGISQVSWWHWHFRSSAGNCFPDAPRNNSCPSHGDTALEVFTLWVTQTAPGFVTTAGAQLRRPLHGQHGSYQERSSHNQQRETAAPPSTGFQRSSPSQYS